MLIVTKARDWRVTRCSVRPPQNVYRELRRDCGCAISNHGNLEKWAKQVIKPLHHISFTSFCRLSRCAPCGKYTIKVPLGRRVL